MLVTHHQVIDEIGLNEYATWIVRRDKKWILESDIFVVYIGDQGATWGSAMEIIFAYENGIPVYVIDASVNKSGNDGWVKFHTKKSFNSIDECFDFILSKKEN